MEEGTARERLRAATRPGDGRLWDIIRELAQLAPNHELEIRRILRPHEEAGFTDQAEADARDKRRRLDAALDALMLFEIGCEAGLLEQSDSPLHANSDLIRLFDSEGFLRYANAYLYFGVRFLAGRLAPPSWFISSQPLPPPRESNERPFALPHPPDSQENADTNAAIVRFLDLSNTDEILDGLKFLDDFVLKVADDDEDNDQRVWFGLWLCGLKPETDPYTDGRFERITRGLTKWAKDRAEFYRSLQPPPPPPAPGFDAETAEPAKGPAMPATWQPVNPMTARFGIVDLYWIARMLRADVSANAIVTYKPRSWLQLLGFHASLRGETAETAVLRNAEEVLRGVFDFTCDLVQNSLEIALDRERRAFQPELFDDPPRETANWRETFDEEANEILAQRDRRRFRNPDAEPAGDTAPARAEGNAPGGWSQRILTGRIPGDLVGLAFSGGGIRSATFNLGVLQGLQEFDLLRSVDYLSTVSGGGFIGSWLVANVRRTSHWLGRLTPWDESIAYLRRYSRYLAPNTGILSADLWAMWFSWLRNAFLIQITGVACLASLFLLAIILHPVFTAEWAASKDFPVTPYSAAAGVMALVVALMILVNFALGESTQRKRTSSPRLILWLVLVPTWIGAFLVASVLWAEARGALHGPSLPVSYSGLLKSAWCPWLYSLAGSCIALIAVAAATARRGRWHGFWIGVVSTAAFYFELCGIMLLFLRWAQNDQQQFSWYAFVFGPSLVIVAASITIVFFIGFCGSLSAEWIREWWTRLGSWVAMFGTLILALGVAAVFGPLWILNLIGLPHWSIPGGIGVGWIGTVLSGLKAGNSSKTDGRETSSRGLEILARVGGLLFIAGAMLLVATAVYAVLVYAGTDDSVSGGEGFWRGLRDLHVVVIAIALAVAAGLGLLFSWAFEINIFGLNHFYRNRLVRAYLGATRWAPGLRKPQPFTGFDPHDDLRLSDLKTGFRGPFPILNCALNLGGSSDLSLQTRHSTSFSLTPLRCGADRLRVGYAPTRSPREDGKIEEFAGGVRLGQAVAISGAAVSPNMGYSTSPLVAFLLTMFNVRLGWWFPNPGRGSWTSRRLPNSLYYLVNELFGIADEKRPYVNVSDGGHFENLGIYELVRRRCRVIIASDAECDENLQFGSLGNLVRICETDFGAKIDIDVSSIRQQKDGRSSTHCTVGRITYSTGSIGLLIYLKASITGDEDVGVAQYRSIHPSFPHETTADQFFSEDQFESYRRLGQHVVRHALRGISAGSHPLQVAEKLRDVWAPGGFSLDAFLKDAETLNGIWEKFRQSPGLNAFLGEITDGTPIGNQPRSPQQELSIALEMIQLMENVFLEVRLDDFWEHPDNRGWALLFTQWARSPRFREIWVQTRNTFGIRFEYFCEQRLGLPGGRPIARA